MSHFVVLALVLMSSFEISLRGSVWRLVGGVAVGLLVLAGGLPAQGQVPSDTIVSPPTPMPQPAPDTGRAAAPPDTSEPGRAIVRADSLSAQTRDGRRLQELFDNVRVRQDTTRLRSNYGRRYLGEDELLFTGDVVIYERGDTLRADTVRYNKRTKVGRAWSNVRLTDGEVVVRAPRAIYYTEEKRSVFPDSVTLVDSNRVLRAQSGTYWSNERRAEFQGHVRLTDPETYLEADSLTYFRDRERSIATGHVFIRRVGQDAQAPEDTTTRTYLFGQWADNQERNRYSRVEGEALLVRVRMDSTGTPEDTLIVRGHRLEAFRTDTYRRLVAVDSVRIWQSDLAAVADSAVYDRVVAPRTDDSSETAPSAPAGAPPPSEDSLYASRPSAPAPDADPLASVPDSAAAPAADSLVTAGRDSAAAERRETTRSARDTTGAPADSLRESDGRMARAVSPPDSSRRDSTTGRIPPPDSIDGSGVFSGIVDPDTLAAWLAPTGGPSAAADTLGAGDDSTATVARSSTPADTLAAESRPDTSAASVRSTSRTRDLPTVWDEENLPIEESRLFQSPIAWFERSQVWGNTIRVRSHNRTLDTVFVKGAAFAAQRDSAIDRIQQLKGRDITAFFRSDSLRRILAAPNAQAIRFLTSDGDSLKGAARASGDRIVLRFRGGKVRRTSVIGGVQSTYYRSPETIPDPFHLQGFQWTPDRKPTKDGLLRRERVRERLDLGPARRRRPPLAQRRPGSRPPDSVSVDPGRPSGEGRPRGEAQREADTTSVIPDFLSVPPDSVRPPPDSLASPSRSVPRDTSQTNSSGP